MNDTPKDIPRRLVFRALADCCGGRARHMDSLLRGDGGRRPGAAAAQASRAVGREAAGRRLRLQAATFSTWIGDPARYQRPAIEAAVFGYLVALCYGHAEALAEMRAELAEQGRPGVLDGMVADDLAQIVDAL